MKVYSPPACGIIAASSAYVSAPARLRRPATTHTVTTIPGVPTLQVMTRALRNTPVPMTSPMRIALEASRPSPRTRPTFDAPTVEDALTLMPLDHKSIAMTSWTSIAGTVSVNRSDVCPT